MEDMIRCDNCNKFVIVEIVNATIKPIPYTTEYGGYFCSTYCAIKYIKDKPREQDESTVDSGVHVQWKINRTDTKSKSI